MLTRRPRSDWLDDIRDPRVHRDVTVYEADQVWHDTGLVDASGEPLVRYVGPDPIGFLWDAERGEPVSRERRSFDSTQCRIDELPEDATQVGCYEPGTKA